jgi:hypothetical protein
MMQMIRRTNNSQQKITSSSQPSSNNMDAGIDVIFSTHLIGFAADENPLSYQCKVVDRG